MSNYRLFYGRDPLFGTLTPKQRRRWDRKTLRDALTGGPSNPTRPKEAARHGGRPPLRGSIARYIAVRDHNVRNGHPHRRIALIPRVPAGGRRG